MKPRRIRTETIITRKGERLYGDKDGNLKPNLRVGKQERRHGSEEYRDNIADPSKQVFRHPDHDNNHWSDERRGK